MLGLGVGLWKVGVVVLQKLFLIAMAELPRQRAALFVVALRASVFHRALARSFSVSLLSCPQAARMSRPRGVRTGLA